MSADRDGRHGEGRLVDDAAADEQDLRQDEHDEEHRDDCAAPEALADAGDDRLGRHAADQKAADGEDGAGGQDRREGKVQRLDDGVAVVHLALQLLIARGDDDGIVDVRAHLDGADDQIAEEEQVFARDRRDGEVDPDTALNDEDQQQRHARGFEREQQDDEHDEHRDDADDRVVDGEGLFKVVFVRAVARDVDRAVGIVFLGDLMHEVGELIRLVAADGQVQIDEHPAEVLTLELVLRAGHLHLRVVQHRGLLVRERDES